MSNKILVLGASGNIGRILVHKLQKRKADFIAGVPLPEIHKLEELNIKCAKLDFNEPASLDNAMKGIDTLFMLLPMEEPMIQWGSNILRSAKNSGVQFILRSSIINAYADSRYALFKVHGQIDGELRSSGIAFSIVHPNAFMQNFTVYHLNTINENNEFYFPHSTSRISYIDARDIAEVDSIILTDPSSHYKKEYTLTGPSAISNSEIASMLSETTGRKISFIKLSQQDFRKQLETMKIPSWNIDMIMSVEQHAEDGKLEILTDDIYRITGKMPISFMEFTRDYAEKWRKVAVGA
jgi:uncharacterized protein YbjT (DUF2867 family)